MRAKLKSPSMWQPFGLSIGIHVLLAVFVVLGTLNWKPFKQSKPVALTIEAVIVDTTQMAQRIDKAQQEAEAAQQRQKLEEERDRALEQQKQREREQEVERQKLNEQEQQKQREREQEQEKQQQAAEQQRRKEQDEAAKRKKEAEDRLAELRKEQERKKEEERVRREKELQQVREQQEEAEKQRKLEAEKLKQLEARDKAAEQAKALQAQQQAELAAKEREARTAEQGRQAELGDKYKLLIQQIVTDNWLRPPTARPGFRCNLKIMQIPGGEVISAAISGSCNGDEATRRSIVAAVERAGSLPYRGYEEVFQREIIFEFIYNGD